MAATTLLVFGLIVAVALFYVTPIAGSIDALSQPREAWGRAGFRRSRWVWQAFGVLFLPAMLAYSGCYFVRVRPRLVAAARELAIERGRAHAHWVSPELSPQRHVGTLKIRVPMSVAGAVALPGVVGSVIGFGLEALGAGSGAPWDWNPLIAFGSVALVGVAGNLTCGVTLTPYDLVMRGLIRRHVPWSDVVAVSQESTCGARYVRLWTRTGRSRRLRAPSTLLGVGRRRFETDFAVIEQWWLTSTSATN